MEKKALLQVEELEQRIAPDSVVAPGDSGSGSFRKWQRRRGLERQLAAVGWPLAP